MPPTGATWWYPGRWWGNYPLRSPFLLSLVPRISWWYQFYDLHVYTLIRFQQSFWMNSRVLKIPMLLDSRFTCQILRVWRFNSFPLWINCNVWGWNSRFFWFKLSWNPYFSWLSHFSPIISPGISQVSAMALFEPRHRRRSFEKASGLVEALIGAVQQVRWVRCGRLKQTWWNLDVTVTFKIPIGSMYGKKWWFNGV